MDLTLIISYSILGVLIVSTLVYIFCKRNYKIIYDHRLLFVIGLVFSRSLTYYAIVDNLMWYLVDHNEPFVRSTVLSNIQESLSSLFVIIMAQLADSYVGRFRTLMFSTTAFISVMILLLIFNPYDVTWLVVIILVLLALGRSGDNLLENVFNDLVNEVDKSENRNKERSYARATLWWNIASASGSISATMWVAMDSLGGAHTTWKSSFWTFLISMTATLMIFCKGHGLYHQGELTHRPIVIFFRVIRARIHELLKSKSQCSTNTSTQERSQERNPENEGITPKRSPLGEMDQGDRCYKEDLKVLPSLLRMFPLWGTFFVVSLISAVGSTFYTEQFDNLENNDKMPVQIYNVIQDFSCFAIPFLYKWTCFRHNQKLKIGVGMLCSIISCTFAWQLEIHRLKELRNFADEHAETSISFLWLVPQFIMLGFMEGLTESGLLTFFWSQVDKPVKNYGEDYMEIVMCLGKLANIGLMLILKSWFDPETNNDTRLDKYYRLLVCICSVNLIIYCCIAICFYKDTNQDHSSSHDDPHQHD
ncbi:protein NRT1/ PTR FAMILY 5.14-like [Bidens hawaiensis]|uniref:protein NRT1/ PTR FAMILY 5.14-like n=1 Tax=Bidens hawaiensis TaxID=980011 RepID=UPI00404A135A